MVKDLKNVYVNIWRQKHILFTQDLTIGRSNDDWVIDHCWSNDCWVKHFGVRNIARCFAQGFSDLWVNAVVTFEKVNTLHAVI